ncbi:MAG: MBL fold metallo-hydrolase [Chlamydiia bacterium]|nr:MBL fold metallo-hydrolase [Chlamydiia bacterium]
MKGFCPLASGSKGNAIYFGSDQTKILIDAGISARATKMKLQEIGVELEEIDAILITHDHHDHIAGIKTLAMKYGIPVMANHETAKGIIDAIGVCPKFKIFSTGETFEYMDLEIHPFTIQHDTLDPVAFTIKSKDKKFGFCADLGFATTLVRSHLRGCDYLYLEANHEPSMVHSSARPMVYKQRVLSRSGHLSNEAAAEVLLEVAHDGLKSVHLAHLSSECNTPEVALNVVHDRLDKAGVDLKLVISPQNTVSEPVWL